MDNPNLTAAKRLADLGIAVFPCNQTKRPQPGVRWKDEASTDPRRIESWWRRWPLSLPAFELGRHQLVAIDCDRHGKDDGVIALETLARDNGDDPRDWPTVETPSTGRHIFFRQDGALTNARGALPAGIDVRGSGGYVIAEGAELPDGRNYHPLGDGLVTALQAGAVPDLPQWLATTLTSRGADEARVPEPVATSRAAATPPPIRSDSGARERAAFEAALVDEVRKVTQAGEGQRNHTLNIAAFSLAQMVASGWGGQSEVDTALTEAAFATGLRQPEIRKTIASGFASGSKKPRAALDDRAGYGDSGPDIEIRLTKVNGVTIVADTGEVVEVDRDELDEEEAGEAPPIDEALTHVDGVLGEMVDWIADCSSTGNRLLALSAALPLMGTLLGRRMATPTQGGGGLELYVISLLQSGGGKSVPMTAIARLMEVAGLDNQHIAPPEFRSGAAFGDFMCRQPLSLSIIDEVADYLAVVLADRQQGHQIELEKLLKEQWGKGFASLRTAHSKSSGSGKVFAPCYSIYGATTPEAFFRTIKSRHVSGGFANRLTVINAAGSGAEREPTGNVRHPPDSLIEGVKTMYALGASGRGNLSSFIDKNSAVDPDPVIVPWGSHDAQVAFTEFERECRELVDSLGELGKIYGRTAFMAAKIATIRACGRISPVTADDMRWGIAIARQSADLFRAELAGSMLDPLSAGEMLMKIEQQFTRPTGKAQALMARYGAMTLPRRFLFQNLKRHISRHPGEFENALKAMQYGGQIAIGKVEQSGAKDGVDVVRYLPSRRPSKVS